MANKRHKPEEIVQKLRQVDVLVGQGMQRVGVPDVEHPRRVQPGMPDDQSEAEAELDRRDRRPDRPVHPAGTTGIRPKRQRPMSGSFGC